MTEQDGHATDPAGREPTPQAARPDDWIGSLDASQSAIAVAPTRIVVADDDDAMRATLAAALRRDGYLVSEARNGDDLLGLVQASLLGTPAGRPLDAIVTDIRMPGRTGIDALIAVRDLDPAIPVVLITAFGDAETHAEARWMGADAVLDKPFDARLLRRTLQVLAPPV